MLRSVTCPESLSNQHEKSFSIRIGQGKVWRMLYIKYARDGVTLGKAHDS